jgi:hypothetical protein
MTRAHSADWMPSMIRWTKAGPVVDWCHLGDLRFTDPFFEQTIGEAMSHPFNLLFRHHTSLGQFIASAPQSPELKLTGLIFHMSRCGSTVVTQMLAALARNVVLSEPTPIDNILRAARLPDEEIVHRLRGMLAQLGRRRQPQECDLFIKFDAWHVLLLPLIRRAFPGVPWIFLYRDPLEVLASVAQSRPMQMFPNWIDPALLASAPGDPPVQTLDEYGARVLAHCCEAAIAHHREGGLPVEYGELPELTRVLDHFGLNYSAAEIAAMRAAAAFDAKNPRVRFRPDGAAKRDGASQEIRHLAESRLKPLHARLEALRLATGLA